MREDSIDKIIHEIIDRLEYYFSTRCYGATHMGVGGSSRLS